MIVIIDLPMVRPPYPPDPSLTAADIIEAATALWVNQFIDDDNFDTHTVDQVVDHICSRMGLSSGKSEVQEMMCHYVNDIILETYEAVDKSLRRIMTTFGNRPLIDYVGTSFPTLLVQVHLDDR